MSAAVAQAFTEIPAGLPPAPPAVETDNVVPLQTPSSIGGIPVTPEIYNEAKAGAQKLLEMSPDELRALIAKRVNMLDTELSEREARRAAIEEAMVAQRVLAARRQRARRLRRKVNIGSSLVAAMFTGLVVVSMF
ncbi:MAG: hypothetical protein HOM58_08200 [Rhodospirillaceae bacterium]|jgi:hypothetical protein|nr:hypothetical protein [Rhodospirillaceae bacterium]MBT5458316.1 hypothetical protein [Rhodospirillaceae bacterium]